MWLCYGLKIFYSEENECNWESKHSFGYVVMFMMLTLGMILIFKWLLKACEILIIIYRYYHQLLFSGQQDRNLITRISQPLRPDVSEIAELVEMNERVWQRRIQSSMDPSLNNNIKSLFFKVKRNK